jgi:sensor c-di-GMP phosphodiesterase-like protein
VRSGVGHSGLSRLKGLGANTIKIDKFFVDTITVDASTTTIVEMLVALARDFHMRWSPKASKPRSRFAR